MNITIVGGGNIGTLLAGELSYKGHKVNVYTSNPEKWNKTIDVLDQADTVIMSGKVNIATNNLEKSIEDTHIVFITLPASMLTDFGTKIEPFIWKGLPIGVIPGSGGAEFALKGIIEKGGILFGLQRVHSIARLKEYGRSVYMLGRKSSLELGSIPSDKSSVISDSLSALFDMPCHPLSNYLCVTLTPSNSILHTVRLYSMMKDYYPDTIYPRNYLFYEEWTDTASDMLLKCDSELQRLCNTIPLNLKDVKSLKDYYESSTPEAMTRKIRSIKAFRGLTSPMIKCEGGWKPDFNSRYFTSDFPYGLKVIKNTASIFNVPSPNMDTVWNWYESVDPFHARRAFSLNCNVQDFVNLYDKN